MGQYNHIETGKSDLIKSILQRIAKVFDINLGKLFEGKNNNTEVYTVNERLSQKVRLLEELDEVQIIPFAISSIPPSPINA